MPKQSEKHEMVIGLTGLKAAGKDEFCRYLAKQGFAIQSTSAPIREECLRRGCSDPPVSMLQDVADEMKRQLKDNGYWTRRAIEMARQAGHRLIVVNCLRNPAEIVALEEMVWPVNRLLVGIVAPTNLRAQRLIARARAGDPTTYEEFMALDDRDRGINEPADGQQVDRCLAQVSFRNLYCNDRSLAEFHRWIDCLLSRPLGGWGPCL